MRAFIVVAALFVAVAATVTPNGDEGQFCYGQVAEVCASTNKKEGKVNCNAKYGAIEHLLGDLQKLVNTHIHRSFDYLLMSTHYANYEKNRAGFEKTFRELSDDKWNTAIEMIKHITKRGGTMDFAKYEATGEPESNEIYEYESMAKALDIEKKLAVETTRVHREASGMRNEYHDADVAHYLEEEFAGKQAGLVRKLSGYTNDLGSFLRSDDRSMALYLFDEYLSKQ